jgi:hypothetical protein
MVRATAGKLIAPWGSFAQVATHVSSRSIELLPPAGSPADTRALLSLSAAARIEFGRRPVCSAHCLHESGLFHDAALIDLLDRFPRRQLYALTMGNDPRRPEENRYAVSDGVSGAQLLRAVQRGRLWLNITRVDQVDARYRALVDRLYAQLEAQMPGFSADSTQCTLLISSPRALVYYHVDGPATVLWHIRGRKRIWVYPALDARFVERGALEDIFAGARHEYLPFDPSWDDAAYVRDLEPGQWIAWPQNAPHRVTNLDSVNVSLSTEHFTRDSRSRARVYAANRFFRARLGRRDLSTDESGAAALIKTSVHWIARKTGFDAVAGAKRHTPTLRIDPDARDGVVPLGSPIRGALHD